MVVDTAARTKIDELESEVVELKNKVAVMGNLLVDFVGVVGQHPDFYGWLVQVLKDYDLSKLTAEKESE